MKDDVEMDVASKIEAKDSEMNVKTEVKNTEVDTVGKESEVKAMAKSENEVKDVRNTTVTEEKDTENSTKKEKIAGSAKRKKRFTDEEIDNWLREFYCSHGKLPVQSDIRKLSGPALSSIYRHLGKKDEWLAKLFPDSDEKLEQQSDEQEAKEPGLIPRVVKALGELSGAENESGYLITGLKYNIKTQELTIERIEFRK